MTPTSQSTLVALKRSECFFPVAKHALSLSSLLSYLLDWLFFISVTTCALLYAKLVPPLFAEFYLYDTNIWHQHIPTDLTIVPTFLLIVYCILVPICQFAVTIGFTRRHSWHRRLWDLHAVLLAMMGAHALQTTIVSLLKNLVGAPRPDMLSRCLPVSWVRPSFGTLSNVSICTQKDMGHLEEGFRSFPSAHSATAFTSAMVQVLFWVARTKMLDTSGWSWKLLLSLVPLLSASAVAFSRISDNRHHLLDILVGMFIGLLAGYLAFIHYFPFPTFNNVCTGGRAYSPRCGIFSSGCWALGDEVGCLRTKLFKAPKCDKSKTFTMGCGTELCCCKKDKCGICAKKCFNPLKCVLGCVGACFSSTY
ncbi:putative lipid phosphate phosphatase 3 [Yarrowia sp. B02]|nr:putative lipid phosphate phosphatase 3 [Yarrowia sp. B02]